MKFECAGRWLVVSLLGVGGLLLEAAGGPQQITYQGQIVQTGGIAATRGLYTIKARIWDNATGGSVIWGKVYPVTVDANGVFNVNLGDGGGEITPLPKCGTLGQALDGGPRFLGITVMQTPAGSVGSPLEMSPRMQLASTPYALRAAMADNALAWNGLSGSQLAIAPSSQTGGSGVSVLGYDGTNVNVLPWLLQGSAATLAPPTTIAGALHAPSVALYSNTIYPRTTNGIALGNNVAVLGGAGARSWGQNYTESADGFLTIPWDNSDPNPSACYVTMAGLGRIYLYSSTAGGGTLSGVTVLPLPAGVSYTAESGIRAPGHGLDTIYFQPLGQ